ncbi:hypothetical protein RI129_003046 [Pyrocoelia pectoralis]|uniref:DUF8207 domain-containing protein n=1 Tax=Pyrocoelia pectoralis TaxID=417401 RepID=A0AAN7VMR6_9COLE
MDNKEMNLKRKIILARKAIRQKYNVLKTNKFNSEKDFALAYKPLIEPLSKMVKNIDVDKKQQHEIKPEPTRTQEEKYDNNQSKLFIRRRTPLLINPRRTPVSPLAQLSYFRRNPPLSSAAATPSLMQRSLISPSFLQTTFIGEVNPEEEEEPPLADSSHLNSTLLDTIGSQAFLEQYHDLPRIYVERIMRDTENAIDFTYGVHYNVDTDKWTMGNTQVNIEGKDLVINGQKYEGTPGLYDLLIMNEPDESLVTEQDESNYTKILKVTNAARRLYDANEQLRGSRSKKYTKIIKPLLLASSPISGSGATIFKELNNKAIEYKYWNNVHELIQDLQVLWAERSAGNTGLVNEIISIVEELYEDGYIEKPSKEFTTQIQYK